MSATNSFIEAAVRTGTPLALAALGETLVERAGIINISLEGTIIAGAFGAAVGASAGQATGGYALAVVAGVLVAALFAMFTVTLRTDQVITGTALTMLALGLTGALARSVFGAHGLALTIATTGPLRPVPEGWLVLGALLHQPWPTYAVYALAPALWWWLYRTHAGLALHAIGENPAAAEAAGIAVNRHRVGAILAGGVMGGLAGATLVLAQAGTFVENMSAGRGFMAIGIVVLGRWNPLGVAGAALLFGGATALQYLFQAAGLNVRYELVLMLPYLATLAALAGVAGRSRGPATLGRRL
ncbi:MAG: ABC-type transporter, integral rane subunit [Gemmatimonadetes bacterium]|nr:ABC-type transporter, integral rane subunit [Gemmatimonadota bacterium]